MVIAYYTHGSLSSFPLHFLSSWLSRLSSSNLGFFGCGVQLAPHSRSFPNSLRFPSLIPFFGSGRPSGAGSPSSIALQQELNECMNGFSHKPARVVRRAYLASTRQHQQENENPTGGQRPTSGARWRVWRAKPWRECRSLLAHAGQKTAKCKFSVGHANWRENRRNANLVWVTPAGGPR